MKPKRLYIKTFGCQMNVHDSERIGGLLSNEGYSLTDSPEDADMIVVNTCSIREKAEQKGFSDLGRFAKLKRKKPELIIASAGCVSQQEGKGMLKRQPGLDLVFGSSNIPNVREMVQAVSRRPVPVVRVEGPPGPPKSTPAIRKDTIRAWVSIMEGCDRRCSFCVVPTTRGGERSRPSGEILSEVRGLGKSGYKEITLLGQTVNSYGKTAEEGLDFADLLRELNEVQGIERIRFISPHPCDMNSKLIDTMADLPKVCNFLHLPVQSGSNSVLERMERGYRIEEYLDIISEVRNKIPGVALSTDIIIGFPGETESDFDRTLELVESVGFDNIFYFNYSPRPHTSAQYFESQVPETEKDCRFQKLRELERSIVSRKNESLVGSFQEVLVEGRSKRAPYRLTGRTPANKLVHFPGPDQIIGRLVPVQIERATSSSLYGNPSSEYLDQENPDHTPASFSI